ncbi:hypothetical protein JXR01_02980 [Candidatus Kaiserbacteria bacterium]|nr:MAG: hypothetical protein JXR01_02980 [Candidatus Kaiserbacteria bacterium]
MFEKIKGMFNEPSVQEEEPLIVVDENTGEIPVASSPTGDSLNAVRERIAASQTAELPQTMNRTTPEDDPVAAAMASITNDNREAEVSGPIVPEIPPSETTLPKNFEMHTPPASPRQPIRVQSVEAEPLASDKPKEAGDHEHLAAMAGMREGAAQNVGVGASRLSIDLGSLDAPLSIPTKETIGANGAEPIKEELTIKKAIKEEESVNQRGTSEIEATLAAIRGGGVHEKTPANENIPDLPVAEVSTETIETPIAKKNTQVTSISVEEVAPVESNDAKKPVAEEAEEEVVLNHLETKQEETAKAESSPAGGEEDNLTVIEIPTAEETTTIESGLLPPTEQEVDRILGEAQEEIDDKRKEEIKEALALYIASDIKLRELLDGVVTEDKRPLIEIVKGAGHASAQKQGLAKALNQMRKAA